VVLHGPICEPMGFTFQGHVFVGARKRIRMPVQATSKRQQPITLGAGQPDAITRGHGTSHGRGSQEARKHLLLHLVKNHSAGARANSDTGRHRQAPPALSWFRESSTGQKCKSAWCEGFLTALADHEEVETSISNFFENCFCMLAEPRLQNCCARSSRILSSAEITEIFTKHSFDGHAGTKPVSRR